MPRIKPTKSVTATKATKAIKPVQPLTSTLPRKPPVRPPLMPKR